MLQKTDKPSKEAVQLFQESDNLLGVMKAQLNRWEDGFISSINSVEQSPSRKQILDLFERYDEPVGAKKSS